MMVGVPVLLVVCDSATVPLVCVMEVGVGVFWWRVFQWWVAVVWASRRVPGVGVCVSWLVLGVCSGVGWLVPGVSGACVGWLASVGVVGASVGVSWLVCVFWWFRMLTCSGLFLFPGFAFLSCLVNNGLSWVLVCGGGCWGWVFSCTGRPTVFVFGVLSVGPCGCLVFLGWWLASVCFVCAFLGGCCARSLVVGLVCGAGRVVCLGGLLGCCSLFVGSCVCGECGCGCLVSVVVWVRGVLSEVAGCLCGWVMRLLVVA